MRGKTTKAGSRQRVKRKYVTEKGKDKQFDPNMDARKYVTEKGKDKQFDPNMDAMSVFVVKSIRFLGPYD